MPTTKKELLAGFQKDWKKYWDLQILKELGFQRQNCGNCGKWFWGQEKQEVCNDASCKPYGFLGNPLTKKKFDYFSAWKSIEKFFVSEGHFPLKRYPVLARWFPGLYFTIAGIVDFYRKDGDKFVFEFPKSPVILLQPSLRFNDIPEVGISGRHWTCHSHVEQACVWDGKNTKKGYWKERCIELDYNLLTKVFGIAPEKINFLEDAWLGAGAFGYSLEYHVDGIELGNAVFTEFQGAPDNFVVMKDKVIDMGAGLERFVWVSSGAPTSYDAVLGKVLEKFRKKSGIKYNEHMFLQYAKLAGALNLDDVKSLDTAFEGIAKKMGVGVKELKEQIEPSQALYAVLDHARALGFAISDGGIPSNIGGGYNLRVLFRRALSFIEKNSFPFEFMDAVEDVAKFFKPLHPELVDNLDKINEVLGTEEKRFRASKEKVRKAVEAVIERKESITEEKMVELYESQGATPEIVQEVAAEKGVKIEVPTDIYKLMTEKHEKEAQPEKPKISLPALPDTERLFYNGTTEFSAKVLAVIGEMVVLDKTAFYPRGGGQEPDFGTINGKRVYNVEPVGKVVVHFVEDSDFKVGQAVECAVDKERRYQITLHHDATHVINESARRVLGPWVWQEGSKKDMDKAHIDLDHYELPSEEQVKKIEGLANKIVLSGLKIKKSFMPREEAEKKYGFIIYQGAPVPSKTLRIVDMEGFDVEACGGTHSDNTKELYPIVILKAERPADGTVRLIYKAGPAAVKHLVGVEKEVGELSKILGVKKKDIPKAVGKLFSDWKAVLKKRELKIEAAAKEKAAQLSFESSKGLRFLVRVVEGDAQKISKELSGEDTVILLINSGESISVFASAGKKAVEAGVDVGKTLKEACEKLGGRGGGRKELAQGIGQDKNKIEEVLLWVKKELMR